MKVLVFLALALLAEAAVKSPFRQLPDENDAHEETQNAEIKKLNGDVEKLWLAIQDFRTLLAAHVKKQEDCPRYQATSGNLVNTLVGGIQKPIIGVTETLTSDYFPFPEDSHRPTEHYGDTDGGGQGPFGSTHGHLHPESHDHQHPSGNVHHQPGGNVHHHSESHDHQHPGGNVHHHPSHSSQVRSCFRGPSAFMRPPRYRDVNEIDFAICHMRPNSALPLAQRGNVQGMVAFYQKKDSKTLYIVTRLTGFNVTLEKHHSGQDESGDHHAIEKLVQQTVKTGPLVQSANLDTNDWSTGHLHGFHVHELSDISGGCDSAGGHYNPYRLKHGGPHARIRHLGDFGNIDCDEEGSTNLILTDDVASLRGQYSIVGKTLVVHADEDDLGSNPRDQGSTTTGNAGTRLACCVIEKLDSAVYNEGVWSKRPESHRGGGQQPDSHHGGGGLQPDSHRGGGGLQPDSNRGGGGGAHRSENQKQPQRSDRFEQSQHH